VIVIESLIEIGILCTSLVIAASLVTMGTIVGINRTGAIVGEGVWDNVINNSACDCLIANIKDDTCEDSVLSSAFTLVSNCVMLSFNWTVLSMGSGEFTRASFGMMLSEVMGASSESIG
jgi:hypothetical protein